MARYRAPGAPPGGVGGWDGPGSDDGTDGNEGYGQENPPERTGGGTGGGCPEGTIATGLDANGQVLSGDPECVTPEEAEIRRNKHSPGWETGGSPSEPGPKGGGGGGTPGFRPASPFPTLSPWTPGKAPTFETPGFTPPAGFEAPKFEWNKKLELTPFNWEEKWQAPSYEEATSDPGYQFRVKEGQRALENNAAAKGNLRSGATLKGLADYNQNAASQEYQNVFNRYGQGYNARFGTAQALNANQQQRELQEYQSEYEAFAAKFAANYQGKSDEWQRAFQTAKERFDTEFAAKQVENSNRLLEYQTNEGARQRQWELEFQAKLQQWLWNNPNATAILEAGLR